MLCYILLFCTDETSKVLKQGSTCTTILSDERLDTNIYRLSSTNALQMRRWRREVIIYSCDLQKRSYPECSKPSWRVACCRCCPRQIRIYRSRTQRPAFLISVSVLIPRDAWLRSSSLTKLQPPRQFLSTFDAEALLSFIHISCLSSQSS